MSDKDIRVLVVEDSLTVRKHIVDVLAATPGYCVVGEATDGKGAIEACQRLRPDVVTMDIMLPEMSGVAATEYIMAYCPTPILIVSASANRGEVFRTCDALAAGAVDVLEKPMGLEPEQAWERQLISTVRRVARIRVITHPRLRLGQLHQRAPTLSYPELTVATGAERRLVVIGASTGGPGAILAVLRALPSNFRLPILLVLHISEPFGPAMAEWLGAQLLFEVRYPKDGEPLPTPGRACLLMAPPGRHLVLNRGRLQLTTAPERHFCRPSVDVLFESVAQEMGRHTIACLLTGMGKDGAQGILAIKQHGGLSLVQNEETSVVFGMPGEAVKLGAASHVLPISDFGGAIALATNSGAEAGR